jgi:hypothetical protein
MTTEKFDNTSTKEYSKHSNFNKSHNLFSQSKELDSALLARTFVKHLILNQTTEQEKMIKNHPELKLNLLLWTVAKADVDEAEKLIAETPDLIIEKGYIKDPDREFENISAFELALYYLNTHHMLQMMLTQALKSKDKSSIIVTMMNQYKDVVERYDEKEEKGGVWYTLNNKKHHERHYSYETYIELLQTYTEKSLSNFNNGKPFLNIQGEQKKLWGDIGEVQKYLPTELIKLYGSDLGSFEYTPNFYEKSNNAPCFFDPLTKKIETWDDIKNLLGDYAISRGSKPKFASCDKGAFNPQLDLKVVKEFHETRKKDLKSFIVKLLESSFNELEEDNSFDNDGYITA